MAIIRWIAGFLITAAAAVFAVINRHDVQIFWNPLGEGLATVPVYLAVLGFMALGFFFGAAAVWMNTGRLRSERRKQKKDIKSLSRQVEAAKKAAAHAPEVQAASAETYPALPARITQASL